MAFMISYFELSYSPWAYQCFKHSKVEARSALPISLKILESPWAFPTESMTSTRDTWSDSNMLEERCLLVFVSKDSNKLVEQFTFLDPVMVP